MPLYDYVCQSCGETVPLFSSVADRDNHREHDCPLPEVSPDAVVPLVEAGVAIDLLTRSRSLKRRVGYPWSYTERIGAFGAFYSEMGPDPI